MSSPLDSRMGLDVVFHWQSMTWNDALISMVTDKCTKAAILWFCFVTLEVPQFGNNISAVLLAEPQNFMMHQRFFCYSATSVENFSHLRNSLLFCYCATLVEEFFSSEKHSAILLLCSHLISSKKPSPESWEHFSCQHINHTVYLPKVQAAYWTGFTVKRVLTSCTDSVANIQEN